MDDKGKGIISYIFGWLGGLIVLLAFKDNDKKTVTHACQAITASVLIYIVRFIYAIVPFSIPYFSSVISLLLIAIKVIGIVKVVNGDDPKIPVIGDIALSVFGSKINATPDVVAKEAPKEEAKAEEKKEEPKTEEKKEEAKPEEDKKEE